MTIMRRPSPLGEPLSFRRSADRLFNDVPSWPAAAQPLKHRQIRNSPVGEGVAGSSPVSATPAGEA